MAKRGFFIAAAVACASVKICGAAVVGAAAGDVGA